MGAKRKLILDWGILVTLSFSSFSCCTPKLAAQSVLNAQASLP